MVEVHGNGRWKSGDDRQFATADEIAVAIVTACRRVDADPEKLVRGFSSINYHKARCYAFEGLRVALPDCVLRAMIDKMGNHKMVNAPQAYMTSAKKMPWWDDVIVDEVCGAVLEVNSPVDRE